MDFKEYQEKAAKTAIYDQKLAKRIEEELEGILSSHMGRLDELRNDTASEIVNSVNLRIIQRVLMPIMRISYVSLGMGEVGEIQNKVKKIIRDHGGNLTDEHREDLKGELGDVLWYVAAACKELDLDMDEVAQANIEKLFSRKERGVLTGSGDKR